MCLEGKDETEGKEEDRQTGLESSCCAASSRSVDCCLEGHGRDRDDLAKVRLVLCADSVDKRERRDILSVLNVLKEECVARVFRIALGAGEFHNSNIISVTIGTILEVGVAAADGGVDARGGGGMAEVNVHEVVALVQAGIEDLAGTGGMGKVRHVDLVVVVLVDAAVILRNRHSNNREKSNQQNTGVHRNRTAEA